MKTNLVIKDEGTENWEHGFWVGLVIGLLVAAVTVSLVTFSKGSVDHVQCSHGS
jgi:hypothetical protein